jgi:gluconokinase
VPDADDHADAPPAPRIAVVMGVAGSGKTAVGQALAAELGWRMIEGDRLHPPANVERMSAGLPLTDELRWGWLDAIGAEMAAAEREAAGAIAACSALKRTYRDRLRGFSRELLFIHLAIDKATARDRVASRHGHFMPASLVDSQFADLEPPRADEGAITLDARRPIAELVAEALRRLRPKLRAGDTHPLT